VATSAITVEKYSSLITFGQKLVACGAKQCLQLSELNQQYNQLTPALDQQIQTLEEQAREKREMGVAAGTQDFIASADKTVSAQLHTVLIYPLVLKDKVRLLWTSQGGVFSNAVCNISKTHLWQFVSQFRTQVVDPTTSTVAVQATRNRLTDDRSLPTRRIRFQIKDTGIGIASEKWTSIFLPFEQAGQRDRNSEGTGLGLAISQQIIQKTGSEIQVQSVPGQGSNFWFEVVSAPSIRLDGTERDHKPAGDRL
jgi:hypothetical protein